MQRVFLALIRAYRQWLSPLLGQNCRFHPSCSQYALEAIESHGSLIGSWLTIKRIIKCQPLHAGGHDPVPDNKTKLK